MIPRLNPLNGKAAGTGGGGNRVDDIPLPSPFLMSARCSMQRMSQLRRGAAAVFGIRLAICRRLFHQMAVPEVDAIDGLPPAVALHQQRGSPTTRSSVGSVTTLSSLFRILYSRAGDYPPGDEGGQVVAAGTPAEVANAVGSRTAPYLAPLLLDRHASASDIDEREEQTVP